MKPQIYHSNEHHIKHSLLNPDALHVIESLHNEGFTTYLVGGGVRDLLRHRTPKDFDISTSATPQDIKRLFRRNCFLIGRRFRLAHVRFGRHILEVSTFRSGENRHSEELITHDNEWGSPEEDALRRDFTINGLFYDPIEDTVIDYVGGYQDLEKSILKTIGDPVKRFKQDPVRMMRLLKFKARFDYDIESQTQQALENCSGEITKSSSARLAEEIFRMLESGHSAPFIKLLHDNNLLGELFPPLEKFIARHEDNKLFKYLQAGDEIIKNSTAPPPSREVLASSLLYPLMEEAIYNNFLSHGEEPNMGQIIETSYNLTHNFTQEIFPHFPRRMVHSIAYIIQTQYKITPLNGKHSKPSRIIRSASFPSALKFLRLRALVEEDASRQYPTWKNHWKNTRHTPPTTNSRRRRSPS
ncbi:MAG: polynucleotide adenylyltransferase PcnB [Chlamydiota bacterium]